MVSGCRSVLPSAWLHVVRIGRAVWILGSRLTRNGEGIVTMSNGVWELYPQAGQEVRSPLYQFAMANHCGLLGRRLSVKL
jgi:hypothetical protein